MSKNLETQKVKVNNGQELIAEAKKYKNSVSEWKFREKYWSTPTYNSLKNGNKNAKWGIIISNGEQEIEIYSENVITNYDGSSRGKNAEDDFLVNRLDEVRVREQLHQIFPEAKKVLFQKKMKPKTLLLIK